MDTKATLDQAHQMVFDNQGMNVDLFKSFIKPEYVFRFRGGFRKRFVTHSGRNCETIRSTRGIQQLLVPSQIISVVSH